MKTLTDDIFVSGQIGLEDLKALANAGVKTIINNRPDGETPGQPSSAQIEAAAKDLGLAYLYLPMNMATGITPALIEGSLKAYETSSKPIFAYCGSGTRSTILWCFANVKTLGVGSVLSAALQAGYDLERIRPALTEHAK